MTTPNPWQPEQHRPYGQAPLPYQHPYPAPYTPGQMVPNPGYSVTQQPKRTNHVLHLILTLVTCGLWGFVWIAVAIYNSLAVDRSTTYYQQPRH